MARMHPPEFHAADGDNPAERKLFTAVRDSLPEPWEAFHSIDWLERDADRGARVGEIDFVLAHPEQGLVTLEVKGGGIDCNHGAWRRRNPDGRWAPMKDPVKQVRDNQFALARLLKRTPEWPIDDPLMSHGLAFPLSSVHQFSLGPGTDPAIIVDRNDLNDLPAAVARILAFHRGARDKRHRLGEAGVGALVDLLTPTVDIRVPLGEQLLDEEAQLESLTAEQSRLLARMRRDPRMVVTGCAGSGKTMLAVNHARRLARDGHRVLFACFNTKLREDLRARYGTEGLEIESVHSLAVGLGGRAKLAMPGGDWASGRNSIARDSVATVRLYARPTRGTRRPASHDVPQSTTPSGTSSVTAAREQPVARVRVAPDDGVLLGRDLGGDGVEAGAQRLPIALDLALVGERGHGLPPTGRSSRQRPLTCSQWRSRSSPTARNARARPSMR
jgi:hypothetical protein